MNENNIIEIELKNNQQNLIFQIRKLHTINDELEKIQNVINRIVDQVLSSEDFSNINLVIDEIKNDLAFLGDDLNLLINVPNDTKDALWWLLSVVQDLYADKENDKINIEEEIRRLQNEINAILEVLKNDNQGKKER